MLERVAKQIAPLLGQVVFVGGHVAELLITDPAAVGIRETDDVDVIVAVTTRTEYHRLGERLRSLGLTEDMTPGAPICRWRTRSGLLLDVMPTDGRVLGFTNQWYAQGIESAIPFVLRPDLTIQIVPAPVFLAMKWVAFDDRGAGDHLGSHDVEDIITVAAGRPDIANEVASAPSNVRSALAQRTAEFLRHPDATYAIEGALPDARLDPELIARVRERLDAIARLT